jgi:hypothetical protein
MSDKCEWCGLPDGLHEKCKIEWREKDPEGFAKAEKRRKKIQGCFLIFVGVLLLPIILGLLIAIVRDFLGM